MYSEQEIIEGFRRGDQWMFRHYFYEYCRVAYNIFDKKYALSSKENLDFMSLAHQYAIYLIEHDWKPLEDRSPKVSLRTWMINGFRYIVLDALKWYKREYGSLTFDEYIQNFDTSQDLRLNFNKMVLDICDTARLDRMSRAILVMLLVNGFKSKDVAAQMGVTPAAISQRYNHLKEKYVIPYFKENFDMDFDMPEVMDADSVSLAPAAGDYLALEPPIPAGDVRFSRILLEKSRERQLSTPEYIWKLAPNEIFVFGSNLRGIHGGGAAYDAYRRFGAVMGQGVGLQGQSYAIPTMQGGVDKIKPYVDDFIQFAGQNRQLTFLVTRIGCGIAGFSDEDIAPLFRNAHGAENIILPSGW